MSKQYRLGVAGLVHDHVWNELKRWSKTGRVEIVAAADSNKPLQETIADQFGVTQHFDDSESMFDNCELDVVQVCTSNADGAQVVEQAAERGIPVVIEKPLSATLKQAERMVTAAERAGILLFVNWPFRWRPETPQAWKLVAEGVIGDVFHARVRMAHKGPREFGCSKYFCDWLYDPVQNGGGALVDYCSYGAVSFRHLFGMPHAVQAVSARLVKQDIAVEDNAAITLLYDKRFAVTEASWSQIPSYHDAVYLGTTGTIWTEEGTIWISNEEGKKTEIPVEPLEEGKQTGPETFLSCLESGEPPPDVCSATVCRDAQEILQAGLQAAESGQRVSIPLR